MIILLLVCCASVCFSCAETIDSNHSDCPEKCVCRKVNDNGSLLKVKCGGLPQVKLTSIKELNFDNIKYDVVQLYVLLVAPFSVTCDCSVLRTVFSFKFNSNFVFSLCTGTSVKSKFRPLRPSILPISPICDA